MESSERKSESIYQLICNCVTQIKQDCLSLLLQMIEAMVKLMSSGPTQFLSLMNKEIVILTRSLFFFYSFSPVRLHFCLISFVLGRHTHLPLPLWIEKLNRQPGQNHQKGKEGRTPIFSPPFFYRPSGLPYYRNGDGNRKWAILHETHWQGGGGYVV